MVHGDKKGAFEEKVINNGAEVFRVPDYTGINHLAYVKAWKEIYEKNPKYTVVHGHVRSTANIYLKIAKNFGLKTIAHSHSTSSGKGISGKIKDVFQRQIPAHTDQFLACSKPAGEWLFGPKIINQSNFHVLNNAIDSNDFKFNSQLREQKRNELGLEDKIVMGHVGRFHEAKNHPFLLEVFTRFLERFPNAVLLLVGDGELRQSIKVKVRDLSIEKSVYFLGLRDDVNELLQAMDLFVMPSFFEGLPVTLVETQAAGLPALISDTITDDIKLSVYVKYASLNSSPEKWADKLAHILKQVERKDTSELIKAAKYDIKVTSKLSFYQ